MLREDGGCELRSGPVAAASCAFEKAVKYMLLLRNQIVVLRVSESLLVTWSVKDAQSASIEAKN